MESQEISDRDAEWREAIWPGNENSSLGKLVATPEGAALFIEAAQNLHHEDIIYFEKRATKARLKRREIQSQLRTVAKAWELSKNSGSDPHFPIDVEAILRAALAKSATEDRP